MKYMLDVILVLAVCWLAWLWNGERHNGFALSDDLEGMRGRAAALEKDLTAAKAAAAEAIADLKKTADLLEERTSELEAKAEELAAKDHEAERLQEVGRRLAARIRELEGYKAQAIVAEMPRAPR
ncbi:MAG: hypothetical protein LBN38_05310 [Verrucomicrobiota bacterium]|jgi:predicted  nucleic acid-binding Zn-ribbon protein|nr:hypothetical protein [Verrucomicrobiota bacterium]